MDDLAQTQRVSDPPGRLDAFQPRDREGCVPVERVRVAVVDHIELQLAQALGGLQGQLGDAGAVEHLDANSPALPKA